MDAHAGQCRECMRRRDVFSCTRRTGGNYRRAHQWRSSSICAECATDLLFTASPDQESARSWAVRSLRDIVAALSTDEATSALAAYQEKEAAHQAWRKAQEERTRPFWDRVRERRNLAAWLSGQAGVEGRDPGTCRSLAQAIRSGEDGGENTGVTYVDGAPLWAQTLREQAAAHIRECASTLHPRTCAALADDVLAGRYLTRD